MVVPEMPRNDAAPKSGRTRFASLACAADELRSAKRKAAPAKRRTTACLSGSRRRGTFMRRAAPCGSHDEVRRGKASRSPVEKPRLRELVRGAGNVGGS